MLGGDDAVDKDFDGGEISGLGAGIAVISHTVTTGSPTDSTRVVFFGTIGSYYAYISGGDVGWDVRVGDEEASVCS
jgi:hypothetical protein